MSDSNKALFALNHLPLDLIEATLPFLPPKSLGRFKFVSKRWYSLISSPEFIKIHIRNYTKNNSNSNPTHLILNLVVSYCNYYVNIKRLNTKPTPATLTAKDPNFMEPFNEILGSCNGLLLARDIDYNLYLLNPTTQKSLKILDEHRDGTWKTYRFGYDSSTDDYKIISIPYNYNNDPDSMARVYSLRNNTWNMVPNFSNKHHYDDYDGPGVLINNNLHWVIRGRRSIMTIAAFSLADEKFHEIELPYSVEKIEGRCTKLINLGEKLVAVNCVDLENYVDELWVMEEYGVCKSWTRLFIINRDEYLEHWCIVQVSNRDILLGNTGYNEIVICNMDKRRCERVSVKRCKGEFRVYGTYVESLESPERFS